MTVKNMKIISKMNNEKMFVDHPNQIEQQQQKHEKT